MQQSPHSVSQRWFFCVGKITLHVVLYAWNILIYLYILIINGSCLYLCVEIFNWLFENWLLQFNPVWLKKPYITGWQRASISVFSFIRADRCLQRWIKQTECQFRTMTFDLILLYFSRRNDIDIRVGNSENIGLWSPLQFLMICLEHCRLSRESD